MCEWGDTVRVEVLVQAELNCTERTERKRVQIDRCIAPLVAALDAAGIDMRSSCCGHGKGPGEIVLQDGRRVTVGPAQRGEGR